MATLIIDGEGYIGSCICVELFNLGYEIIVTDNFSNSKPKAVDTVKENRG